MKLKLLAGLAVRGSNANIVSFLICSCLVFRAMAPEALAASFKFVGNIAGHELDLKVYGDVGGASNILYQGVIQGEPKTTWNQEWQINAISDWAVLDSPFDESHYSSIGENHYAQLMLDDSMDHLNRGFTYSEIINGALSSEYWMHQVMIDNLIESDIPIDALVGVEGAFGFYERTQYWNHYTMGSPIPSSAISEVTGYLTLESIDWSDTEDHTGSSGSPVPEPATIILLGTGLVGLIGAQKAKKIAEPST